MAVCPKCGSKVSKPEKSFKNFYFVAEIYVCPKCGTQFKEVF